MMHSTSGLDSHERSGSSLVELFRLFYLLEGIQHLPKVYALIIKLAPAESHEAFAEEYSNHIT